YTFPQVPPGSYRIEAETQGFKKGVRTAVLVDVQQTTTVDMQLAIGSITKSVEVTGALTQLQTNTSSPGQVVENRQIRELPLVGRNALSLIGLTSGAQPMGAFGGIPARTNGEKAPRDRWCSGGAAEDRCRGTVSDHWQRLDAAEAVDSAPILGRRPAP